MKGNKTTDCFDMLRVWCCNVFNMKGYAFSSICAWTHAHTHKHIHARTHAHTHTYAHTHTHTLAHTQTHTHAQANTHRVVISNHCLLLTWNTNRSTTQVSTCSQRLNIADCTSTLVTEIVNNSSGHCTSVSNTVQSLLMIIVHTPQTPTE